MLRTSKTKRNGAYDFSFTKQTMGIGSHRPFHKGQVRVRYYRGLPLRFFEVAKLQDNKSITVITHIKSAFARHGIPSEMISDNGPQYSSKEFESFARSWEFKHTTTSPLNPQANGLVEKAVQTVKNLLTKAEQDSRDPYLALLEYRNTPIDDVDSPA